MRSDCGFGDMKGVLFIKHQNEMEILLKRLHIWNKDEHRKMGWKDQTGSRGICEVNLIHGT